MGVFDANGDPFLHAYDSPDAKTPRVLSYDGKTTGYFNWGYSGTGPANVAIAIIADVLGISERSIEDDEPYRSAWQRLREARIAKVPQGETFSISEADVRSYLP